MKLSRHGRVWLTTIIWLTVGGMLIWRGVDPHLANIATTGGKALALGVGALIGLAKGLFVISKSAARTAAYIRRRPERDWFWLSVHPILYLLIPLMIGFGYGLKAAFAASQPGIVVAVYVGIGAALITGTRGFRAAIA